jgi:hypothetical protein
MLLGTYHFANPGQDVIKQDIDDRAADPGITSDGYLLGS